MVKKVILFFAGIVIVIVLVRFGYVAVNNGLGMGSKVINNTFSSVFGTDDKFIGDYNVETAAAQSNLGQMGSENSDMSNLFK